ncbi:MAG: PIG-L deacetylase family protein [Ornithinimicrobium sp.]
MVAVNAHPDDEAILMGGTLARLSAEGHRVVLVTATDGGAGVGESSLGARRLEELHVSATALGVEDVIDLGYGDSGMGPRDLPTHGTRQRLHTVPVQEAGLRVAEILAHRAADLVIGYDRAGGYGHRDHVQIHHIVRTAARISDTRIIEATAPREPILRALRVLERLRLLGDFESSEWAGAFTPKAHITHSVDVRSHLDAKRAALSAHASQTQTEDRSLARVLALPRPVFTRLLGREFFIEPGRMRPSPRSTACLADLVGSAGTAQPDLPVHARPEDPR